jgi:hypothetical protein
MHVYEVRPRRDRCGVDLISDALPFGSHSSVKLLGMAIYNIMGAVMALGILMSCTAQTTGPTRVSEVKDRHNFRDEQEGAPRVDTAPINP